MIVNFNKSQRAKSLAILGTGFVHNNKPSHRTLIRPGWHPERHGNAPVNGGRYTARESFLKNVVDKIYARKSIEYYRGLNDCSCTNWRLFYGFIILAISHPGN